MEERNEKKALTKAGYLKQLNEGTYSDELTKIKKQLKIGLEGYIKLAGNSSNENAKKNSALATTLLGALDDLADWKAFLNRLHHTSLQCQREFKEVEVSKDVEGTFSTTTKIKTKDVPVKNVNDFPDLLDSTLRDALAVYHGVLDAQKDSLVDDVLKFNKAAVEAEKKLKEEKDGAEENRKKQKEKKEELKARTKELEAKVKELEISNAGAGATLKGKEELVEAQQKHLDSNDESKKLLGLVLQGVKQTNKLLQLEGPGNSKLSGFKDKVISAGGKNNNNNRDFGKYMVDQGYAPQAIVDMLKILAKCHLNESKVQGSKVTQQYADAAVKLVTTYGTSMKEVLSDVEFDWSLPKGATGDETIDEANKEKVLRYAIKLIEDQCNNRALADVLQGEYKTLSSINDL